jgi:adenosine deaminase
MRELKENGGDFRRALLSGDLAGLIASPKADLHCHSMLSTSLQSIQKWAGTALQAAPSRMRDFDEMRRYLHEILYPHIYHRKGFEFTAESSIREAVQDGVTVLEMSHDVNFIQFYRPDTNGFLDFVQALVQRHRAAIDFRPEIGISKNRPPAEQIPLADECIQSNLFQSIDLYGNEMAQPPEAYQDLYRHAASRGLKLKAHVGEFGDAPLVEKTVQTLGLHEIQHGIAVARSARLMKLLRKEQIRLNVCPGSNVAISVADDLAHHPIGELIRNGVRISINSDDKTVFGRSVSEEYLCLFQSGVASAEELDAIRRDSLRDDRGPME